MCGHLLCVPYWGPGLQTSQVPDLRLGIKPGTLWFIGWHSTTELNQPGLTGKV